LFFILTHPNFYLLPIALAYKKITLLKQTPVIELIFRRKGMIASLFCELLFGMGRIAAAVLRYLANFTSLIRFKFCAFLPLRTILLMNLPDV